MDLTPRSGTSTKIDFPYLLPSDILGRSIGLPSSQAMNINVPPSPTVMRFSTHSVLEVSTMEISQPGQTSTFNASMGS